MAANIQYIKFYRGTPEEYAKITSPNSNTLYFICEKDSNDGKLYLGSKLIAGSSLTDLNDIDFNEELEDGQILQYNALEKKWTVTTAEKIVKSSGLIRIMKPATATEDGVSGYVPQPLAGEHDKLLNGAGEWIDCGDVKSITDSITWGSF